MKYQFRSIIISINVKTSSRFSIRSKKIELEDGENTIEKRASFTRSIPAGVEGKEKEERRKGKREEEGSCGFSLLSYQLILLSSNPLVAAFARFGRL